MSSTASRYYRLSKTAVSGYAGKALAALGVFALLTWSNLRPLFGADLSVATVLGKKVGVWITLAIFDQRYAIWAATRNASALLHPAAPFFDSGQCYPVPHSLALGHGAMALGLWALPASLVSRDPLTIYNLTLIAIAALSPLVVWLLVVDWTDDALAGTVAGAFYGFHVVKLGAPEHVFLTDTAWFVLSLYFLRRFLRDTSQWKNGVGFALSGLGQLAAGVYPALGALFAGTVVLFGLLLECRPKAAAYLRLAIVAAATVSGATALMWHYLSYSRAGVLVPRGRIFMSFESLKRGGEFFPGAVALLLAAAGALPFKGIPKAPSRALRASLVVALVFVAFLATGGLASPAGQDNAFAAVTKPTRLYEVLANWVPGLSVGRGPAYAYGAAHACLGVLVGLGFSTVSALARRASTNRVVVQVSRSALAALAIAAFLPASPHFERVRQKPPDREIALFEELDRRGNKGPVLELPPLGGGMGQDERSSTSLLLAAYHRRRTSACFASFGTSSLPPDLQAAIARLPAVDALDTIAAAGFTTIWVHRKGIDERLDNALRRLSKKHELVVLRDDDDDAVYGIAGTGNTKRQ